MCPITAREQKITPRRLTSSVCLMTSSLEPWTVEARSLALPPATLTRMSIRPCCSMVCSTMAPMLAVRRTSVSIAVAVPPSAMMASATAWAGSPSISQTTTAAPSAASRLAVVDAICPAPPVMMATLCSRPIGLAIFLMGLSTAGVFRTYSVCATSSPLRRCPYEEPTHARVWGFRRRWSPAWGMLMRDSSQPRVRLDRSLDVGVPQRLASQFHVPGDP